LRVCGSIYGYCPLAGSHTGIRVYREIAIAGLHQACAGNMDPRYIRFGFPFYVGNHRDLVPPAGGNGLNRIGLELYPGGFTRLGNVENGREGSVLLSEFHLRRAAFQRCVRLNGEDGTFGGYGLCFVIYNPGCFGCDAQFQVGCNAYRYRVTCCAYRFLRAVQAQRGSFRGLVNRYFPAGLFPGNDKGCLTGLKIGVRSDRYLDLLVAITFHGVDGNPGIGNFKGPEKIGGYGKFPGFPVGLKINFCIGSDKHFVVSGPDASAQKQGQQGQNYPFWHT